MYDVVFYEVFKEEEAAIKRYLVSKRKTLFVRGTIQEHRRAKLPALLISVRTQSRIPTAWASRLQGILTRSTGYDHLVDYQRRTKTKAACGYLPGYCSRAVAEQSILMLMALWRKLPAQTKNFIRFQRDKLTGQECQGKNLLVVGVGRIGSEIVDIGRGLGMRVKGVDIAPKRQDVDYVALALGMAWADAVVCATPLTATTRNMFNGALFSSAKPGIVFINIARGEISPLKDIQALLKKGVLGGLGMDVYEHEDETAVLLRTGQTRGNPFVHRLRALKKHDNVIFTPHNAFNTEQSVDRKARQSVEAIELFLARKFFPNIMPLT